MKGITTSHIVKNVHLFAFHQAFDALCRHTVLNSETIIKFYRSVYVNTAIHTVPAVKSASPIHAFTESFSLNTMRENITVTSMLSLSMGTTTLTCPC